MGPSLLQQATPEYLNQCRAAQAAEQQHSLASTNNWAHVDKPQAHADFDAFYKELAPLIDANDPASPAIQTLMAKHYAIASRFYAPSRDAYVGTALFYEDNADMKAFHNGYHPRMVEFLGDAVYRYARGNLS
ncbi:TipAS antibiotic-recognition protein [Acidovorax sp. 69]|uniref:TipAS antibiotic-recognition domain-containing protein n=1 Tax=Acidovorax sp. 69 TaxID=2035202 RepID=UPI000C24C497|nr:TipAS antibiotic-recognition domain-containing protein [Acidovorax sp. 69]PJI96753.1 TipAS antibiotic-recognition protein [Acidovorax sp. 69]